jgi:hypothetical protein
MSALVSLIGRQFGRLSVASRAPNKRGRAQWNCRCACGGDVVVYGYSLLSGNSTSCGCKRTESVVTHGRSRTREYIAWRSAKARCYRPTATSFPIYGGRGIRMTAAWLHNFAAFYAYLGPCPAGFSIDRIDNDGDYEPGNVRWASKEAQSNNRRANRVVLLDGDIPMTVAQIARAMEIDWHTAHRKYGRLLQKRSSASKGTRACLPLQK